MATENRKKTLYYKRAEFFGHAGNLADLLKAALRLKRTAGSRLQRMGEDAKSVRLVNHFAPLSDAVCGTMLEFTEGNAQPIVDLVGDLDELPVSLMGTGDSQSQFVEGTVFFLVMGNHVILAQSKSLRAVHVEQHWDWLLRSLVRSVPEESRVLLQDHVPAGQRRRLQNVRSIKLTPDYMMTDGAAELSDGDRSQRFALRGLLLDAVMRVLESSSNRALPKELDVRSALAEQRLRATIEVSVSGRMPDAGVPMLDGIAAALRHTDDVDYVVHVPGLGDVKSGDLRLKYDATVPFTDGMPDPSRLYVEMHNWLVNLMQAGELQDLG